MRHSWILILGVLLGIYIVLFLPRTKAQVRFENIGIGCPIDAINCESTQVPANKEWVIEWADISHHNSMATDMILLAHDTVTDKWVTVLFAQGLPSEDTFALERRIVLPEGFKLEVGAKSVDPGKNIVLRFGRKERNSQTF